MSIFGKRRLVPGEVYEGPASWTTDYSIVDKAGFYALAEDGKTFMQPLLRLVAVDDAPGDPDDGSWHLEVASPHDPPQRAATGEEIEARKTVDLEANPVGESEVNLG